MFKTVWKIIVFVHPKMNILSLFTHSLCCAVDTEEVVFQFQFLLCKYFFLAQMQKSKVGEVSITSNLTEEKRKKLCGSLGNVELTLLFKASVHGYKASAFHQRCDRRGPTLLVAYNRSGYIFGGYTSLLSALTLTVDIMHAMMMLEGPTLANSCTFATTINHVYNQGAPLFIGARGNAFGFSAAKLYGDDTRLSECEVYKVEESKRRDQLMEIIRKYKPLVTSVSRFRILMIGPVGAGKSSFFNSINAIFTGHVTSKAMSGFAGTSLTTQFRTYPVKDGAGLDIEDISSILQGHVPDRYKVRALISKMNEG
uniref:TLDc domain-containing protein n=1 Tax=Sinocyclocheilus rhinocerous TaxID=307959 RepID=A0A673JWI2_9TELE